MKWIKAGDGVPQDPEMKQWRFSETLEPALWHQIKRKAVSEDHSDEFEFLDESGSDEIKKLKKEKGEYKFDPHIEYPDLTGLPEDEKKKFIDGLCMEVGKHVLAAFMALGLEHYMDFTINNGDDYFRFHFYKIDIKSPNHDHLTILKLQTQLKQGIERKRELEEENKRLKLLLDECLVKAHELANK